MFAALSLLACSPAPTAPPPVPPAQLPPQAGGQLMQRHGASLVVEEAVYDIGPLPRMVTPLADDPRRATVEALCTACHSARYITAQPPLEASVWHAEITKMIEGFGATIPPDKRGDVEGYLVDHYGPGRKDVSRSEAQPTLEIYKAYCIACHGPAGQGVPGAFPPLAEHAAKLGRSSAGRTYMVDVVLHGLAGRIEVSGTAYDNMMPPLAGRLSDAEVASVLNDIRRAWPHGEGDDLTMITADDVRQRRLQDQTPQQTHQSRPKSD